eukprot:PhF_6_TR37053/c0_g1_i4/m.54256
MARSGNIHIVFCHDYDGEAVHHSTAVRNVPQGIPKTLRYLRNIRKPRAFPRCERHVAHDDQVVVFGAHNGDAVVAVFVDCLCWRIRRLHRRAQVTTRYVWIL